MFERHRVYGYLRFDEERTSHMGSHIHVLAEKAIILDYFLGFVQSGGYYYHDLVIMIIYLCSHIHNF